MKLSFVPIKKSPMIFAFVVLRNYVYFFQDFNLHDQIPSMIARMLPFFY